MADVALPIFSNRKRASEVKERVGEVAGRTIKNNYKTFRIVISSKLCIVYYRSSRHREKEREKKESV